MAWGGVRSHAYVSEPQIFVPDVLGCAWSSGFLRLSAGSRLKWGRTHIPHSGSQALGNTQKSWGACFHSLCRPRPEGHGGARRLSPLGIPKVELF